MRVTSRKPAAILVHSDRLGMLNDASVKCSTAQKLGAVMSGFPFFVSQRLDESDVVTGMTPLVEGQSAVGMDELTASHAFG